MKMCFQLVHFLMTEDTEEDEKSSSVTETSNLYNHFCESLLAFFSRSDP